MTEKKNLSSACRIRIVNLERDPRIRKETDDLSEAPVVGDEGTLVDHGVVDGRSTYIVEKTTHDAGSVWVGEFFIDEIEVIDDHATQDAPTTAPKQVGYLVSIISLMAGNALAATLCLLLLNGLSVRIVFFAATISSLIGVFTAEHLSDGVRFTVIVAIITWLALLFLPIPEAIRHVGLSAASGICTSRLIVGGYRDFRQ